MHERNVRISHSSGYTFIKHVEDGLFFTSFRSEKCSSILFGGYSSVLWWWESIGGAFGLIQLFNNKGNFLITAWLN
jgi:hypothetical protein